MDNKRLFSIVLVVFIDLLGYSLILPLLPYYAQTFHANQTVTGLLLASYSIMQLIGAPILGRLSDRFGRRPILLLCILGTTIGFLMMGLAATLWMLFASRMLDGLTGGNFSVTQAYISDVTNEKDRSKALGMTGAAFGLGFIVGPVTGGLLGQWNPALPAFVAAAISLINFVLVYAWLPESLTREKRAQMIEKQPAVTWNALLVALRRPFTSSLFITGFFFGLAFVILQTIFALHALVKFNMTSFQTGLVLTYVGILSVIMQGFLVGRLTSRFREDALIVVSAVLLGVGLLGWGLASNIFWLYMATTPIALFGGLLGTLLSSTLTKAVAPHEIGGILGLYSAMDSSTRVIGPIIGGILLQQVGAWAPGAFGAVLMAGVSIFILIKVYNRPIFTAVKENKAIPSPAMD
ncbi:MAG: MFS transporter [Chloroflexi bacterium]|nr:MFS transporter [Chloroflexota bacterium]